MTRHRWRRIAQAAVTAFLIGAFAVAASAQESAPEEGDEDRTRSRSLQLSLFNFVWKRKLFFLPIVNGSF